MTISSISHRVNNFYSNLDLCNVNLYYITFYFKKETELILVLRTHINILVANEPVIESIKEILRERLFNVDFLQQNDIKTFCSEFEKKFNFILFKREILENVELEHSIYA